MTGKPIPTCFVVHHMIVQQISTKAQAAIWQRMKEQLEEVKFKRTGTAGIAELQSLGMTFRKAEQIKGFAVKCRTESLIYKGFLSFQTTRR